MAISTQVAKPQQHYLLIGTYTGKGSKGIYVYKFNSDNGDVQTVDSFSAVNPSYLAVAKDNAHVYAVNESGNGKGAVSAYSFDNSTGKLQLINTESSKGDDPCHISIDASGGWVAVANYSSGNFSIYKILPGGGISPAVQTIQHTGQGPDKERQEGPHAHSAVFTPDNKHLAVADLGLDKIMVYKFDADKEKPLDEKAIPVSATAGSGPRHIAFHPSMSVAYVIGEMSGNVEGFSYKDGKFTSLQSISAHPEGFKGEKGSAEIRISPDGKFLYASNREASNTIACFSIDSKGMLKTVAVQPSGGIHPRDFNIDPSGDYLLAANMRSDNVVIYKRDKKSGRLTDSGKKLELKEPVAVTFIDIK